MLHVSICQQTLTLLSQKFIHLKILAVYMKDDNILFSRFQKLQELTCYFPSRQEKKILLKDLPMIEVLDIDDVIELLQIDNVPMFRCLKSGKYNLNLHRLVILSPLLHLISMFLGFNFVQFENLHFLSF